MNFEQTSVMSFQKARADGLISKRHMQVIEYLWEHRQDQTGVSQGDVGRYFNDASSSFQPRFRELEFNNIITCVGTKFDTKTKRTVKAYQLTGDAPTEKLKQPPKVKDIEIRKLNQKIRKRGRRIEQLERAVAALILEVRDVCVNLDSYPPDTHRIQLIKAATSAEMCLESNAHNQNRGN